MLSRQNVLSTAFLLLSVILPDLSLAQTTYYPATGIYNGFLNQINIIECDNSGSHVLNPTVRIFALDGREITALAMNIGASGTQHVILNDLLNIKDTYGTFRIELPADQNFKANRLVCRTAFYLASSPGSTKTYDFAYVLPVRNPDTGDTAGVFNSFNPAGSSEPTNNWLSVVNLDTSSFSAEIKLFDAFGNQIGSRPVINLAPASRVDLALGHDLGQVVGTYLIVPVDKSTKYQAFLTRYGVLGNKFKFAFPLQASKGSCSGNLVQLSTMGSAKTANWFEVVNLSSISIPVKVIVRDRNGQELRSTDIALAPYAQHHIFANEIIDPQGIGNVGSAQVLCQDPSDKIITQSLFYGRGTDLSLDWAYASQDTGMTVTGRDSQLSAPTNTFLGMANWLKLSNTKASTVLSYNVYDNAGRNLSAGEHALGGNTTGDIGIHAQMPPDSIGSTVISSQYDESQFSGELLRIVPKKSGEIGTIIQIPGSVQPKGSVNQISTDGGETTGFIGNPNSLSRYRENLTYEEAFHFLTRVGFGASIEEVRRAQAEGLAATVSRMINIQATPEIDQVASRWLDNKYDEDLGTIDHVGAQKYFLHQLIHTPNPFRERMALIWHDLFAASCVVAQDSRINNSCYLMLQTFRNNALGNFRTLASAITIDNVMLRWLNGNINKKGVPDENYSREFWELFTLGEVSKHPGRFRLYSSKDISESARAFTGWTTPTPPSQDPNLRPVFVPSRFDDKEKTIFEGTPYAVTGKFGHQEIIDYTLLRPEAAEWVVKRLFSALVHDRPSPGVINELRDLLISSNYEVVPVLRKLLLSEALFSTKANRARVKDGGTFAIGFIRSTRVPVNVENLFKRFENQGLGYQPLYPPSVNGWQLNKYQGAKLTEFFLGWAADYANVIREVLTKAESAQVGFNFSALIPFEVQTIEQIQSAPERLIDHWSLVMGIELTESEKDILVDYMHKQRNSDGSVALTLFNPKNAEHVRQKVPGLLWILAQHEDYLTF